MTDPSSLDRPSSLDGPSTLDGPFSLEGRVVLITGASRGVGAATALAAAARGARVACVARSTDAAPKRIPGTIDQTVAAITETGGEALAIPADLTSPDDIARMVSVTVEHWGRLDVLVNNAAVTFVGDVDIELKRHDLVMAINVQAPLLCVRAALPHMRAAGRGRIARPHPAQLVAERRHQTDHRLRHRFPGMRRLRASLPLERDDQLRFRSRRPPRRPRPDRSRVPQRRLSDTVLEPGMVVSMEPMIMIPEGQPGAGGYREHDILVINQDGSVDNITAFPYGPDHNIVPST